jgi:hypothetical protein
MVRDGLAVKLAALCTVAALTAGTALAQNQPTTPTTRPRAEAPWSSAAATPARQPATQEVEADLPVRAVTLYSSGVGYFEHAGTVDANQ